jgi:hypothetical protein
LKIFENYATLGREKYADLFLAAHCAAPRQGLLRTPVHDPAEAESAVSDWKVFVTYRFDTPPLAVTSGQAAMGLAPLPNSTSFVADGRLVCVVRFKQSSISAVEARETYHALKEAGRDADQRLGPLPAFARYGLS